MIEASGKTLATIYISHGDPDFYFGLDVFNAAFPDARIVATAVTVEKIKNLCRTKKHTGSQFLKRIRQKNYCYLKS
ncbi:hypothetical protein ACU6U9_04380 [Pseudomonas sp. HK3]